MGWTHTGAEEKCENTSPVKEVATETTCDELTTAPLPHPLGERREINKE